NRTPRSAQRTLLACMAAAALVLSAALPVSVGAAPLFQPDKERPHAGKKASPFVPPPPAVVAPAPAPPAPPAPAATVVVPPAAGAVAPIPTAKPAAATTDEAEDSIVLNFENADIREVIYSLAVAMNINYWIDPRVQGQVTVRTSGRLSRADLEPIFH